MSVRKSGKIIAGTPRTTGGVEIGDMGFAPLGIDESLNLRRYLNGQVISQTQFVSFTNKLKAAVALYPSLATTEENWQSEKALSKFGQVGKFVVDDTAGTIRLPCVVNAQGLADLALIGGIKNESLPNIKGTFGADMSQGNFVNFGTGAFGSYKDTSVSQEVPQPAGAYDSNNRWNFDASRSSSTYQDNEPVQQEAVQYPYYIQVATGIEETLPAIREYKTNVPYVLGDSKYSETNPYNASWLVSNGQYHAKSTYPDMWTQLQVELNSSLNKGDTVVIDGKTYVKRGLPVKLSTDTITDYDWVVNTADETFRLPLLDGSEDLPGDRYEKLTLQESGSPYTAPANGWYVLYKSATASGQFNESLSPSSKLRSMVHSSYTGGTSTYIFVKKGDVYRPYYSVAGKTHEFVFVYAKGNGSLYYYVGDTVQDASLINAGAVLGQLSNKADIDASNFNASGRSLLSGLGMPSNQAQQLTLLASGQSYTAPSNGWFSVIAAPNPNSYIVLTRSDSAMRSSFHNDGAGAESAGVFLPVLEGMSVSYTYGGTFYNGVNSILFIPAKGEN